MTSQQGLAAAGRRKTAEAVEHSLSAAFQARIVRCRETERQEELARNDFGAGEGGTGPPGYLGMIRYTTADAGARKSLGSKPVCILVWGPTLLTRLIYMSGRLLGSIVLRER